MAESFTFKITELKASKSGKPVLIMRTGDRFAYLASVSSIGSDVMQKIGLDKEGYYESDAFNDWECTLEGYWNKKKIEGYGFVNSFTPTKLIEVKREVT